MTISIPFSDIQHYLNVKYNHDLAITTKSRCTLSIKYHYKGVSIPFDIEIKNIQTKNIIFGYKTNMLLNPLIKVSKPKIEHFIKDLPIIWNEENKEIDINFNKINLVNEFLTTFYLKDILFEKESIVITFNPI